MVNVLVLDDDFFVGQIHARYVDEVPGFTALEPVRDLKTAREVIAENEVDLLLVDYVLPEGTGVELIRETDIEAIVLSAGREVESGALADLVHRPRHPVTRGLAEAARATSFEHGEGP